MMPKVMLKKIKSAYSYQQTKHVKMLNLAFEFPDSLSKVQKSNVSLTISLIIKLCVHERAYCIHDYKFITMHKCSNVHARYAHKSRHGTLLQFAYN